MVKPKIIFIKTFPIRLGQFLKLANVVLDGMEAKFLIQNGEVMVNGHLELQRGRQLSAGDIVQISEDDSFLLKSKE